VKIGDMSIGRHARPLIVAEMSGNHNQSLERALEIVDAENDVIDVNGGSVLHRARTKHTRQRSAQHNYG